MNNARYHSLKVLNKVLHDNAYSNLLLNEVIENEKINELDKKLLTEIVYGTLKNLSLIDFYLEPFIKGRKVKGSVRNLLRLSIYQVVYLDRVPNHAIINEAVNIAKSEYGIGISKFVNAVLRNFLRNEINDIDKIDDKIKKLSIKTSHPEWLLGMWSKQYDYETAEKIAYANMKRPNVVARVNKHLTTKTDLKNEYEFVDGNLSPDAIIFKSGNIAHLDAYKDGEITIQDESSQLVSHFMDLKEEEKVLDMCSAPGSKTTHIASLMNNTGLVYAYDIHDHKISLIKGNAKRQQLTNIRARQYDSTKLHELHDENTFDKVLLDAPCSGFGVIARKPDILHHKIQNDLDGIISLQKELLSVAASLVKKDGILVYSTCTINKKENEKQIESFLKEHKNFELVEEKLILQYEYDSDGFYIAKMRKIK